MPLPYRGPEGCVVVIIGHRRASRICIHRPSGQREPQRVMLLSPEIQSAKTLPPKSHYVLIPLFTKPRRQSLNPWQAFEHVDITKTQGQNFQSISTQDRLLHFTRKRRAVYKSGIGSHRPLVVLPQKTAKVTLFKDIPLST